MNSTSWEGVYGHGQERLRPGLVLTLDPLAHRPEVQLGTIPLWTCVEVVVYRLMVNTAERKKVSQAFSAQPLVGAMMKLKPLATADIALLEKPTPSVAPLDLTPFLR